MVLPMRNDHQLGFQLLPTVALLTIGGKRGKQHIGPISVKKTHTTTGNELLLLLQFFLFFNMMGVSAEAKLPCPGD